MCGLFGAFRARDGFWPVKKIEDFMYLGLHMSVLRGHCGTGVGTVDKNDSVLVDKSRHDAITWMFSPQYEQVCRRLGDSHVIMGHTRAPTFAGTIADRNAQPYYFENTDSTRAVMMTHNGHINNHTEVTRDIKNFTHPVDSAHICRAMAEYGAKTTLEKLRGGFALAWHDDGVDKFYIATNNKRPLAMAFSPDMSRGYYASESGMLRFALDRTELEYGEIFEIPDMKVLSWTLDGKKLVEEPALDFQDPPSYQQVHTGGKNMGGVGISGGASDTSPVHYYYVKPEHDLVAYGRQDRNWGKKKYFGKVHAYSVSRPEIEIEINGINSQDWEKWKVLKGTGIPCKINSITTLTREDGSKYQLYSTSVVPGRIEGELKRIAGIGHSDDTNRRALLVGSGGSHKGATTLTVAGPRDRKVPGPEGEEISFTSWRETANEGCADCNALVLDIDVGKVSWLPMNERVEDGELQTTYLMVCPLCTQAYKDNHKKEDSKESSGAVH